LGLGLDLTQRNADLEDYLKSIQKIAQEQQVPWVDIYTPFKGKNVTTDGMQLSEQGHRLAAEVIAKELGVLNPSRPINEQQRAEIVDKNKLWQNYWMPTNWEFLYGNRQDQPSSHRHNDPSTRWFPEEVNKWLSALENQEKYLFETRRSKR
jgi:hypothetical protein